MANTIKISIQVPHSAQKDRYFSFSFKQTSGNEPSLYKTYSKIFVVSDIEGNFTPFFKLLVVAGVISTHMEWTFGDGHLVVLGDCFDRGEEVTECLWLIYALEQNAKKANGKVHFILGNHEIMNMNGDWRYIHPKYATHTLSNRYPHTAFYAGNNELWNWLKTKNIIEKIGSILFVHGGISKELLDLKIAIPEINEMARPYYDKEPQTDSSSLTNILFNGDTSPFWYRGYYLAEPDQEMIRNTLSFYQVHTIITGHTITDKIGCFCNQSVINVNTDHANGTSEGLLIIKDRFFRIDMKGKNERIRKA